MRFSITRYSVVSDDASSLHIFIKYMQLRPDFTSKLLHGLAFGKPKFYIAPYDKINHGIVNLSCNCDVKSGLSVLSSSVVNGAFIIAYYV